jgi:TP901 family phage tail tape measure protein
MSRAAVDYETAMLKLQGVTGATTADMAKVGDAAKRLGSDLNLPGTSAADAADGMLELAKAGLTTDEAMAAARGTMQLAKVAGLEVGEAATIAATSLNAFKLPAKDAARVTDLLAAAANASSAEVSDMALALQQSSAVFAANGQSVDDLTTSIALMANAGIKGSDAGTSLKTMMMKLTAPTSDAQKAFDALGLELYDSAGNMYPMRDIIAKTTGALEGMTQEQRNAQLATMFGTDAVRAANIVLAGGVEQYDAMAAAVGETGAANDMLANQSKGLAGAFDNLKSVMETVVISMVETFGPALGQLIRQFTDFLGTLKPVFDVLAGLAKWFLNLAANSAIFRTAIAALVIGFLAYKAVMIALALPTQIMTAAQLALNVAMALNPVGLVVAAIVLLIAALVAAYKKFEPFRNLVKDVWAWIKKAAEAIGGWRNAFLSLLGPIGMITAAMDRVRDKWNSIKGFIDKLNPFRSGGRSVATYTISPMSSDTRARDETSGVPMGSSSAGINLNEETLARAISNILVRSDYRNGNGIAFA